MIIANFYLYFRNISHCSMFDILVIVTNEVTLVSIQWNFILYLVLGLYMVRIVDIYNIVILLGKKLSCIFVCYAKSLVEARSNSDM